MELATDELSIFGALKEMPAGTKSHTKNNLKKCCGLILKNLLTLGNVSEFHQALETVMS